MSTPSQRADATRRDHDESRRALHVAEYALAAPAPRRERTWRHRVAQAVSGLADAIDRQVEADDHCTGLLAEVALVEPQHIGAVADLCRERQALRIAIASLLEQLDDHPELPIDTEHVRAQFAELARQYREHHVREAALIHLALDIDITAVDRVGC